MKLNKFETLEQENAEATNTTPATEEVTDVETTTEEETPAVENTDESETTAA